MNALLHASSSHPAPTKNAIPTGQFLRARRICSQDHLFRKQATDLMGRWRDMKEALARHWKILKLDPAISKYIPQSPSITYRRSRNLRDSDQSRIYDIRKHITCRSEGVIYCASCPCNLMYIGLTTRKLKVRIREHVIDIQRAHDDCSCLSFIEAAKCSS